jgi:hypothetical protein
VAPAAPCEQFSKRPFGLNRSAARACHFCHPQSLAPPAGHVALRAHAGIVAFEASPVVVIAAVTPRAYRMFPEFQPKTGSFP